MPRSNVTTCVSEKVLHYQAVLEIQCIEIGYASSLTMLPWLSAKKLKFESVTFCLEEFSIKCREKSGIVLILLYFAQ